jgi:hypothetical protein
MHSLRFLKASSSSNSPFTKRMPAESCSQTVSLNGVRACCVTESLTCSTNSSSLQSRRPKPTRPKLGGRSPRFARS